MILAIAQSNPKTSLRENLADHYQLAALAIAENADIIIFPEMSLTGYTREQAKSLSLTLDDERLDELHKLAVDHEMSIIAGAPARMDNDLFISSFIFSPDGTRSQYIKQNLHGGEKDFFSSTASCNPTLSIKDNNVSLAVCADISHPIHPCNAANKNCTIYAASIFYTKEGMEEAHYQMSEYAQMYEMCTLISNYCGEAWNLESGGKSAFWSEEGELIGELSPDKPSLLVVEQRNRTWKSKKVDLHENDK